MKKHILLTAVLFAFAIGLKAQITLDSSDYAYAGKVLKMAIVKNSSVISIGGAAMQTWDFSGLRADTFRVRTFHNPDSLPWGNVFPGSNLATDDNKGTYFHFRKNADSISLSGIHGDPLSMQYFDTFKLEPDLAILRFPFSIDSGFTAQSTIERKKDTIISMLFVDSVRLHMVTTNTISCTGYGTMQTPGGSYQVLRLRQEERRNSEVYLHTTLTGNWSATPFITLKDSALYYRWYTKGKGQEIIFAQYDLSTNQLLDAEFMLSDSLFGFIDNIATPTCFGASNGEATAKVIVGSGNYTYQWSANAGGQTTAKATGLKADTYTVSITDLVLGQVFVDTLILTQPDAINISLLSKTDEDSMRNNGAIEISVSGGTAPYSYAWSSGASSTSNIASGLKGGVYSVTVTDAYGCTKSYTDTINTLGNAVGMAKAQQSKDISVYPNPAHDYLFVETPARNTLLQMFDIKGVMVRDLNTNANQTRISLQGLPVGMYMLRIGGLDKSTGIKIRVE
jgi:hypothetical protein